MPPKSQKEREEKKQDESNKKRWYPSGPAPQSDQPDKRARIEAIGGLQTILNGGGMPYPDTKADEKVIYGNATNDRLHPDTAVVNIYVALVYKAKACLLEF
jgi:hypothetical protein